ncbi:MAG: hypothetical protein AB4290_15740 [Spirulina sp.]
MGSNRFLTVNVVAPTSSGENLMGMGRGAARQRSGFKRMKVTVGGWDFSNTTTKSSFCVHPVLVTKIATDRSAIWIPCNGSISAAKALGVAVILETQSNPPFLFLLLMKREFIKCRLIEKAIALFLQLFRNSI